MSQNLTISRSDWLDIEKIKPMLLENKSQTEIASVIGKRRETINRKLSRWMQTKDFETWLKQAWLEKYRKVNDVEAFRGLTKIMTRMITQRAEITETVDVTEKKIIVKAWQPFESTKPAVTE